MKMSRVSYEGNTLIIIPEGQNRNKHYYYELSVCTASTDPTISSMVQKYIVQKNSKKMNEIKKYTFPTGRPNSMGKHLLILGADKYIDRKLIKLPTGKRNHLPISIYDRISSADMVYYARKCHREKTIDYHPDKNDQREQEYYNKMMAQYNFSLGWIEKTVKYHNRHEDIYEMLERIG